MGKLDPAKIAAAAGTGAAIGAPIGGWGAPVGALVAGGIELFRELFHRDPTDDEMKQAEQAQYGGNEDTNRLGALDVAAGLQGQQAQNEREAAFYNQANQNFDIANAAQMREAGVIRGSAADQARQLQALQQSQSLGSTLTDMGTRPMGDSYAEAQLRQGQAAAMAQQLAMARSGRSLGSGQAAMTNAAFNNAALNQQTNQSAAIARIQEQNAYNQHQVNALQQAGVLAGQAGNQANTIRADNELLQGKNIANAQQQQQINNATTQTYNNLGAGQQDRGMDANRLGVNERQFGVTTGANRQVAQVNADIGHESQTNQVNAAQQERADRREAANWNTATTGLATAAEGITDASKPSGGSSSSDIPSNPNEAYKNITTSSNVAGPNSAPPQGTGSDAKNKTNVQPLSNPSPTNPTIISGDKSKTTPTGSTSSKTAPYPSGATFTGPDGKEYPIMVSSEEEAADARAWAEANKAGKSTYTDTKGQTQKAQAMDPDTNKVPVTDEPRVIRPDVASYVETINALNDAYRASQRAPADVLNRVPGAGAGPSASQSAVMAKFLGQPSKPAGKPAPKPKISDEPIGDTVHALAKAAGPITTANASGPIASRFDTRDPNAPVPPPMHAPPARTIPAPASPSPAPKSNWGDVFNKPVLSDRVNRFLAGESSAPIVVNPSPAPAPVSPVPPRNPASQEYAGNEQNFKDPVLSPGTSNVAVPRTQSVTDWRSQVDPRVSSGIESKTGIEPLQSDDRSKTRIRELEGQVEALGGAARGSFAPKAPDYGALDQAYAREQNAPAIDLRPAQGYSYEYKNPKQPGAAPGRHVGPMAQDLLHTAAASTVLKSPDGLRVNTDRLSLVNTAALSEQQKRLQELQSQFDALSNGYPTSYPRGY